MSNSKIPEKMLLKLRAVIANMAHGTYGERHPSKNNGTSEDFQNGLAEGYRMARIWRETYLEPELRQILAWAEGVSTVHEIIVLGHGYSHGKPSTHGNSTI